MLPSCDASVENGVRGDCSKRMGSRRQTLSKPGVDVRRLIYYPLGDPQVGTVLYAEANAYKDCVQLSSEARDGAMLYDSGFPAGVCMRYGWMYERLMGRDKGQT